MTARCIALLIAGLSCLPCIVHGQESFDYYISNSGNDNYSGTLPVFPKKTITAASQYFLNCFSKDGMVRVGLQGGDLFKENLTTSYPIQVGTYTVSGAASSFATLDGSQAFESGWVKDSAFSNIFEQDIPYSGFTGYGIGGIGSYSYIYVTEIDRELEKTAPITARKPLQFVASIDAADATPGSFYSPVNTTENPKHVYVHASDGSSPNNNAKYRYEVTVRDWAINSTYQPDNVFENLWVRGFGAGIGMLPGGDHSSYNKIIFGPGAGVHHLVVRSGTIDHSLFLPGAKNTSGFAVVFYDDQGLGRHCTVKNSIFMDIPAPLYCHTSFGTNFGAVEVDNVVAYADTTNAPQFIFTSNNDTVLLNNVYTDGYLTAYNYGKAKYSAISDSYFKDVLFGIGYSDLNPVTAVVKDVFIKTKGNDYTAGIYMQANTSLTLSNSIFHIINNYRNYWANAAAFIYGTGRGGWVHASGNIFICDIAPVATLIAANTNGAAESSDKWDNNVYVLFSGNKIAWTTSDPSTNGGSSLIQNFQDWQRISGQDTHSLFFDLRHDPRGLKAIFVDPDNGNYDLANTAEGYQIAALHAGMTTAPNCFLKRPTYEEAADLISNSEVPSLVTCRNPCLQHTIKINTTFAANALNERQVRVTWNISEQQNINEYQLQKATGNSDYKHLATFPVIPDSSYSFTDNIEPGVPYQYRLVITDPTGNQCFSDARTIKTLDNQPFAIFPNPSNGKIFISLNGYIGNATLTVTNSGGQMVFQKDVFNFYTPQSLDLTLQPKGIYFLKVNTVSGYSVQKFVLQ